MDHIKKLLKRPGYRYLIVGGLVYAFELAVIVVAQWLGATAMWAVAISFCLGSLVSFFMQKIISFGDKRMHHRVLIPQMVAIGLLLAWNLAFSVMVTKLLQDMMPAVVTRTLALGITVVWNFYLYKTRIFKNTSEILID